MPEPPADAIIPAASRGRRPWAGARGAAAGGACLALALAPAGEAQVRPLDGVFACSRLGVDAERLACFDKAVADLNQAEAVGDLAVVSRQQVEQVEREAFGLAVPAAGDLAAAVIGPPRAPPASAATGDKPDAGAAPASQRERLERVTLEVARISRDRAGKFVFEMANGQVWRQTDSGRVRVRGDGPWTAEIRRAVLSGFFLNLDGQTAIRVRRSE